MCQQEISVLTTTEPLILRIVYNRIICLCKCNQNKTPLIRKTFKIVNKELKKSLVYYNEKSF